jgi:hypothetical protein
VEVKFLNDTGRTVSIHSATKEHGCQVDMSDIKSMELRVFELPEGTSPFIKLWDYGGERGLSILVSSKF